jgi:hypothetical protein
VTAAGDREDPIQADQPHLEDRLVIFIDILQYLQQHPKFRRGRPATIAELARAILLFIIGLYCPAADGGIIIFCMDVGRFMTYLRRLQQEKRKKMPADVDRESAAYGSVNGDTLLEALGPYHILMRSLAFRERLAAQIVSCIITGSVASDCMYFTVACASQLDAIMGRFGK